MQKTVILNHKSKKNIALISLFLILASCGGGGGSSGGSPGSLADNPNNDPSTLPTNPTPPTQTFDQLKTQYENNYEYSRQWGLATINASAAYARGATGSGITIGITDSGLDSTHDEISFTRLSPESNLSYSNYTPNTRQQRHGTMVSSVAAGSLSENDDSPMHGVAFNSNILFTAIQLAEPDENYDPVDLKFITLLMLILSITVMGTQVTLMTTMKLKLEMLFQKPLKKWRKLILLTLKRQSMFGLQEMQDLTQTKALIIPVRNYFQECQFMFQKFKAIQ